MPGWVAPFWTFPGDLRASRGSVQGVTDPFLLSANDGELALNSQPTGRTAESEQLSDADFNRYVAQITERVVRSARRWAPLVARLDEALEAAGFHRHDPYSAGGGYHMATHSRDDGVLVCWAARQDSPEAMYRLDSPLYQPDTFERAVERIMNPALLAVLTRAGFAGLIPPSQPASPGPLRALGQDLQNGTGLLSAPNLPAPDG